MKAFISKITALIFLTLFVSWHCATFSNITTDTTLVTAHGFIAVENLKNDNAIIGYTPDGTIIKSRIVTITSTITDTIIVIK